MKAYFIYKDGKLVGHPVGYTTAEGAKKSLVGSEDWHRELKKYDKWHAHKENPPQELIDMKMYEWSEYTDCWLFERKVWSTKVWNEYVKKHYQFLEKEYEIIVKD